MEVKSIMSRVTIVDGNITLKEAAIIMSRERTGSVIIEKKGKLIGIITENDIIKNIKNIKSKVSRIMSKKVITVDSEENIDNAALLMAKKKIRRLPVLNNNSKILGIITATDIVANSDDLNENFLFD